MIGLVNAIGATQPGNATRARPSAAIEHESTPRSAPLLSDEAAANAVLHSAVEAIQFDQTPGQRGAPSSEQSDQFQRAEREAGAASGSLGRQIDYVA